MRRLLPLLLVAACGKADGVIVVSVTANPALSGIAALHTKVSVGTHEKEFDVLPVGEASISLPPAHTFGVQVSPSLGTTLHVEVEARDGSGKPLGSAAGDAPIHSDGTRSDLPLEIGGAAADLAGLDLTGRDLAEPGSDLAIPADSDLSIPANSDLSVPANSDLAMLPDLTPPPACNGVTGCANGDGCCYAGCNALNDNDCAPVCGNNVTEPGELCDDGNTVNGDNCDPSCQYFNVVSTLAGRAGGYGYTEGQTGTAARFLAWGNVIADGNPNEILFTNSTTLQTMNTTIKTPTTVAGRAGVTGTTDGVGTAARFGGLIDLVRIGTVVYLLDSPAAIRTYDVTSKTVTTLTSPTLTNPRGMGSDGTNLLIVDDNGLHKWNPTTAASTVTLVSNLQGCDDFCYDVDFFSGDYYLPCNTEVGKVTGAGVASIFSGPLADPGTTPPCSDDPNDVLNSSWGTVSSLVVVGSTAYLPDFGCNSIRKINLTGTPGVTTYSGVSGNGGAYVDDFNPVNVRFNEPQQIGAIGSTLIVSDAEQSLMRIVFSGGGVQTLAGSPTALGVLNYGASGAATTFGRPNGAHMGGLVSDGTNVYLSMVTEVTVGPAFIAQVALAGGASSQLASLTESGIANGDPGIARIGSFLYTSHGDGTIRRTAGGGSTLDPFAGTLGTSTPVTNGPLLSAKMFPVQMTSDGTNLYFVDAHPTVASNVIRKIDIGTSTVSTIAGTVGATDIKNDPVGTNAHFQKPTGITSDGTYLYVLDGNPGTVVRRINIATTAVDTIVGMAGVTGSSDGVGSAARFAGANYLTTDGKRLFISDSGVGPFNGDFNGPTIREVDLATLNVTTMVGTRGQWTTLNGIGAAALVNKPGPIAWDSATHSLVFYDLSEYVLRKIQ